MSNTKYTWTAFYEDYTKYISQFSDGKENLFSDIEQNRLTEFALQNEEDKLFGIDFNNGVFFLNGTIIHFEKNDSNRLIYFRRIKHNLGIGGSTNEQTIIHIIGVQSTVDGKNKKLMFGIDDSTGEISYVER